MKKHAMLLSAVAILGTAAAGFCAEETGTSERGVVLIEHASAKCPSGFVQSGADCVKPLVKNKSTSDKGKKVSPSKARAKAKDIRTSEEGMKHE